MAASPGEEGKHQIINQMCVGWRLAMLNIDSVTDLKDITNAFASIAWSALSAANGEIMKQGERQFGEQRFRWAAVLFKDSARCAFLKTGVGALIGDPWAVKVFTRYVNKAFEDANADYEGVTMARWCFVEVPLPGWEGFEIDLSFNSYVDDAVQKVLATGTEGVEMLARRSMGFDIF